MSFRRLYAGPLLICEYEVKERPTKFRNCSKTDCPRYGKQKNPQKGQFCTQCGSPVITFDGRVESYVYPVWSDVDAAFHAAGLDSDLISRHWVELDDSHIYQPNQERGWEREFDLGTFSENPPVIVDMAEVDIEAEKQWLATVFATEIEFLKTLYVSVEIKWMILS